MPRGTAITQKKPWHSCTSVIYSCMAETGQGNHAEWQKPEKGNLAKWQKPEKGNLSEWQKPEKGNLAEWQKPEKGNHSSAILT